jgi:serine/threonine protein kinase/Tfp pilus assembly protein PilF
MPNMPDQPQSLSVFQQRLAGKALPSSSSPVHRVPQRGVLRGNIVGRDGWAMDSERWRRLEQLYHAALEQEPARRDSFLARACREDTDLRQEVESLLAQSGSTSALVDRSAWAGVNGIKGENPREWKPGEVLGSYKILKPLGEGGMGAVYEALDIRLNRKVAVKVCHERFSGRFERETRAISALNHPNICTLYDAGPDYLVMELVEGDTLRALLQRGLPDDRGLSIAKQVLAALGAAHAAGIVHRDLKPANIMVRADGYVKVLDFGLAKRIPSASPAHGESTATLDISLPGQMLGTVAYMSPEQISGEAVDQRSDLFAFGIILYETLAGQHPWPRGSAVEVLHAILHDDPPPIEHTLLQVTGLAPIVRKLLCKNATARYESAGAVLEALASPSGEQPPGGSKPLTSIAVLPFAFLSDVEGRSGLSLGFADALITMLANLDDVAVAPTSAILKYAPGVEPAQVCRELGVRYAMQGNVQKLGAEWRVSMQLFDNIAQRITFTERHDFHMENVFEAQDEIGRRVVKVLDSHFGTAVQKSRDRYSSDPEAYGEFMTGLRASYGDSPEEFQSAVQHLSRAIEFDAEFALAHAWLSHVSMQMHYYFDPHRAWLEKAEYHYERALTLDPDLPEAHWARSAILWSSAKNFQHEEAIAALQRVLAARPNFDRAHNRMAAICMHIGRLQEARIADERAQRCNPKNRSYNREFICQYGGDFARAKEFGEAWFRESPRNKNALWYSAHSLLLMGDLDEASERLTAALAQYPEEPLFISMRGMLHARRRQRDASLDCVRKSLEYPVSFGHAHHTYHHVACVYSELGETEKAIAWLEKSIDSGNPCWPFFRTDPYLENLRNEIRFHQLVSTLERKFTALTIERL